MCRCRRTVQKIAAIAALLPLQLAAASPAASEPYGIDLLPIKSTYAGTAKSACVGSECGDRLPLQRLTFGTASGLSAALVEVDSNDPPGQHRRPRYGLGMRSPALESALDSVGLDARQCLAPVVRMSTKLSTSFGLSGTLWVYLRCSFH